MKVLQVKQYNNEIASRKLSKALERWRNRGYGYPVKTLFYFMITDNNGYAIKEREKGYIAFNERKACFGFNRNQAIKNFEEV